MLRCLKWMYMPSKVFLPPVETARPSSDVPKRQLTSFTNLLEFSDRIINNPYQKRSSHTTDLCLASLTTSCLDFPSFGHGTRTCKSLRLCMSHFQLSSLLPGLNMKNCTWGSLLRFWRTLCCWGFLSCTDSVRPQCRPQWQGKLVPSGWWRHLRDKYCGPVKLTFCHDNLLCTILFSSKIIDTKPILCLFHSFCPSLSDVCHTGLITQDSQLIVMLTALLRPSAPSHQYSPPFPLMAVNVHVSDLSAPAATPGGEHQSVSFKTFFLTLWPAETCASIQPEELVWDEGHRMLKRSPLKICLLLGVKLSEWGGTSWGEKKSKGS